MNRSVVLRWQLLVALLLGACASVVSSNPAGGAEVGDGPSFDFAAFQTFVESVRAKYRVPGLAVALVHHDQAVVVSGYGRRQFDSPEPVDKDTLFSLASVTKAFTAALVATFVDDKKLDWDRPVIEDFPELVLKDLYATRMATPRDLLAHRTGLPAFIGDLFDHLGYDRAEVIRRLRYVEPACSFREHGNYSNLGYFAAGMLAQRVGQNDWETLMQKRVLGPLGMKNATFTYRIPAGQRNRAAAHFRAGNSYTAMPWVPQETLAPAGGMAASIADMVPFLRVHLAEGKLNGKPIFSAESIREMHRPAMVDTPGFTSAPPIGATSGLAFALGWDSYHYRGYEVIEKGGALGGTRTVVSMIPELGVGVAVFANLNMTLAPEAIRGYVLEQFTGGAASDMQDKISQTQDKLSAMFEGVGTEKKKLAAGPPTRPLEIYAGSYASTLYGPFVVTLKNGALAWSMGTEGYGGPLAHVDFDTFEMEFPPGTVSLPEPITFVLGDDGTPAAAESEILGRMPRNATN